MKFSGELKFPEIDHPGVPVSFIIEGTQAELSVDGESLGRWSLYDIHARRLVASAFQIDLDGTEVTFVADDPIGFAYRGVEHMAETWAKMSSKGFATRSVAVRKSRKGTAPSRIEEMKSVMVDNLQTTAEPRQVAGEVGIPDEELTTPEPTELAQERAQLEEERQRLAEERARFDEERRVAEQREADRIEAYRLEMKRLEAERAALTQRAEEMNVLDEIQAPEQDAILTGQEAQPAFTEPEPGEGPQPTPVEPTEGISDAGKEPVAADLVEESQPAGTSDGESELEEAGEPEEETGPEPGVVDLDDLEEDDQSEPATPAAPEPPALTPDRRKEPEPAISGATKDRSGLMGAVRAAFSSSPRDHQHQFIEAPGGIGITRYVCEECGYVSISV